MFDWDRVRNIRYDSEYLRYIERTEGMRFTEYPVLFASKNEKESYNVSENVIRHGKIIRTLRSKVYLRPKLLLKKNAPYGVIVLLHEMREILYFQNDRKFTKTTAHNRAFKRLEEDINFVGRKYGLDELDIDKVFGAFGSK